MAYPTRPDKAYSYTAFQQAQGDNSFPGTQLDADLANSNASIEQIIAFLRAALRSDGRVANGSVGREQLGAGVTLGFEAPTDWATGRDYAVGDTVFFANVFYIATEVHTAAASFTDDLNAGRWLLLVDFTAETAAAEAARDAALLAQGAAEAAQIAAAADAVQTGLDAAATGADAVQTGLDAAATAADRVQTGLDAVATAADRVQTGLDAAATAADAVQTGLDAAATAADVIQTGLDAAAAAASAANPDLSASSIGDLSDVDLTTTPPVTGDGFVYDGSDWVPGPAGGGMFKGDNGTVGSRSGDIFRINNKTLTANTTIAATENASATGPLAVDTGVTLTVASGGTLAVI